MCPSDHTLTTVGVQLSLAIPANHIYANVPVWPHSQPFEEDNTSLFFLPIDISANVLRAPLAKEQLVWTPLSVPVVSASCLARTR